MKKKSSRWYTRREFLKLGVGLAAGAPLAMSAGCGGGSHSETPVTPPVNPPTANSVAIVSCKSYNTDLQSALSHGAELLGGLSPLVNGKTVTVKVNLTSDGTFEHQFGMLPGESFITDGRTAIALARLLLAKGARKVRFVDSAAFRLPLDQVLALAQWDVATLLSLGNVEVENTRNLGNGSAYARLDVPNGGYMFNYFQLNHSYQDTDVFVSMGKDEAAPVGRRDALDEVPVWLHSEFAVWNRSWK